MFDKTLYVFEILENLLLFIESETCSGNVQGLHLGLVLSVGVGVQGLYLEMRKKN